MNSLTELPAIETLPGFGKLIVMMVLIAFLVVRLNALYERIRSDVYWYRWNRRRRESLAAMRANLDAIKRDRQ